MLDDKPTGPFMGLGFKLESWTCMSYYVARVVLKIRTHHSGAKVNNVRVLAAVGAGYKLISFYFHPHTYIPWACSHVEEKKKEKNVTGK
jgi:hypothetical protein